MFITQGGEGRGKTNKKREATKSEGRGNKANLKKNYRQGRLLSLPGPRAEQTRAPDTRSLHRDAVDPDTARQAWDPGPWHDYANDDCAEDAEVFANVSI